MKYKDRRICLVLKSIGFFLRFLCVYYGDIGSRNSFLRWCRGFYFFRYLFLVDINGGKVEV